MPVFSNAALDDDDGLARLHEILHGKPAPGRSVERRDGRFAQVCPRHPDPAAREPAQDAAERFGASSTCLEEAQSGSGHARKGV